MRALAARASALTCAIALAACGTHGSATGAAGAASAAAATAGGGGSAVAARVPDGNWLQFNYNAQRTGVGPAATGINAGNLRRLSARVVHLPGTVDGSVIALRDVRVGGRARDVLIMTTTYGRTLAIDARTGRGLWEYTPADIGSYQGSAQITTATPTADPSRAYVYATSPDGYVHKLKVSNGHQLWETKVTLVAQREKLASPPTVEGSSLIVVTDGYFGDAPPYQGHVVSLSLATGRIQHVFNTLCSDRRFIQVPSTCGGSDSAIWGRAGAVLVPGSGDILVSTGNGPFNGSTDWGDSVLELAPYATGLLHNYTPTNQVQLSSGDQDLGSTSPALLPDPGGPPLIVQGGKDAQLKLLDLDRLDGTSGPASARTGGALQMLPTPGGGQMFTAPVVWVHSGHTYLFVADGSGTAEYLLHSGSHPRLVAGWSNGTAGTSPVLAGGLLYVYDPGGTLDVYSPTSGHLLHSFSASPGHWNSPIAVGGRVVLPVGSGNDHSTSGRLYIWHLPGR
ncbi:MAG TPA: PQQ-binding-like beta-propeller repeat protein [Solirubrobacteraceae bacterium]|nr:PQQ-binding-like beta-propeller repeat protein [Solirubrobacteraceae bacterium]